MSETQQKMLDGYYRWNFLVSDASAQLISLKLFFKDIDNAVVACWSDISALGKLVAKGEIEFGVDHRNVDQTIESYQQRLIDILLISDDDHNILPVLSSHYSFLGMQVNFNMIMSDHVENDVKENSFNRLADLPHFRGSYRDGDRGFLLLVKVLESDRLHNHNFMNSSIICDSLFRYPSFDGLSAVLQSRFALAFFDRIFRNESVYLGEGPAEILSRGQPPYAQTSKDAYERVMRQWQAIAVKNPVKALESILGFILGLNFRPEKHASRMYQLDKLTRLISGEGFEFKEAMDEDTVLSQIYMKLMNKKFIDQSEKIRDSLEKRRVSIGQCGQDNRKVRIELENIERTKEFFMKNQ